MGTLRAFDLEDHSKPLDLYFSSLDSIEWLKITNQSNLDVKNLIFVLRSLTPNVSHLDLSEILNSVAKEDLAAVFAAIPEHITHLNLEKNNFQSSIGPLLKKFIGLKYLNLKDNFQSCKTAELTEFFKYLPKKLETIHFNTFKDKTAQEISLILGEMPDFLKALHLDCVITDQMAGLLAEGLSGIYKHVAELSLSNSELGKIQGLSLLLAALPKQIQILKLKNNELYKKGGELAKTIPSISKYIFNLDLSQNFLFHYDFSTTFAALPMTISCLNLSGNFVSSKDMENSSYLLKNISAIAKTVRRLSLAKNYLAKQNFVEILSSIPEGVFDLDISNNGFDIIPTTELSRAFVWMSPKVNEITLSMKDVAGRSNSDLVLLGKSLGYIKKITLVEQGLPCYHPSLEILRKHMGQSIGKVEIEKAPPSDNQAVQELPFIQLQQKSNNSGAFVTQDNIQEKKQKENGEQIKNVIEESYAFQLKCLYALSAVSVTALAVGVLFLAAQVVIAGAVMTTLGLVGGSVAIHGIFNHKGEVPLALTANKNVTRGIN